MDELGVTQSLRQARRLLDEIALSGGWKAGGYGMHSIDYTRGHERLTIVRKGHRQWAIVKTLPLAVEEAKTAAKEGGENA